MSTRIQHKRSSIEGRRPSNRYLEPGEIALNTNQGDPGLFFETNTGDIAKVGPTSIGLVPPETETGYGPGETWYDSGNGTMNIWVPALNRWVPMLSSFFGGAQTAIFVGSEFPEASDDLTNDGVARPFATLNRAMLEVARRSVLAGRQDDVFNARFTIILLPGRNVVYNEPGISLSQFESTTAPFVRDQEVPQDVLRLFNSPSGGLLVPRGTSIVGLDLRKTVLVPTYYPHWSRDLFLDSPELVEKRTSLLKWTGNSYFTSLTFKDKVSDISVTRISGSADDTAVLTSLRPHGFRSLITTDANDTDISAGDVVTMSYPEGVARDYDGVPTLPPGNFYADPIDHYRFRLRKADTGEIILRKELPKTGVIGASPANFLSLTFTNTTHHRLSTIGFATTLELDDYYSKVQLAFSNIDFGGTTNNAEVVFGETSIVAPLPDTPTFVVDSTKDGSPYVLNVSIRSDWGLCGVEVDGFKVSGFKSALTCNFTSVSLQNDSEVYEVYEDGKWISLKQSYVNAQNAGAVEPISISDVTNQQAIDFLLSNIKLEDIRYFVRFAEDIPGQNRKSSGLVSDISDTRHYVVKASNGGYAQTVASFAIGVAVNYWAIGGGSISVTNANSNFGGIALRAEGFTGIGTTGGAEEPDTGFTIQGIRRPAAITRQMVLDPNNTKKIYFNSRIVSVTSTSVTFADPLDPTAIFPFTLSYGSYIWAEDYATGTQYSAQLVTDGTLISTDKRTLYVVNGSNGFITTDISPGALISETLSVPFIRRFQDPRPVVGKVYSLWIRNTSQTHRPPEIGCILRFAERPASGVSNLLVPGKQLDPGSTGGWGHLFQVIDVRTKAEGDNPNQTEALAAPSIGSSDYYVALAPVDQFRPWVATGSNGFSTGTLSYPQGFYSTYQDRIFYAQEGDLSLIQDLKPVPVNADSVWTRSKSYEYCQPISETWTFGEGFDSAEDPFAQSYEGQGVSYTYPRGLQFDKTSFSQSLFIDRDNGQADLGLVENGVMQPQFADPWWSPSKMAMTRFLALLGYTYAQIDDVLKPQIWTSRNLPVTSLPAASGTGYALSTGTWPIEFNRPSIIRCGNHTWEWCGYLTYAKGLPKYQRSQLSLRQRFDYICNETWGGIIYANGNTERGELVLTGKAVAGGTGATIYTTDSPAPSFGVQDIVG